MKCLPKLYLFILLVFMLCASTAIAAAPALTKRNVPTNITADAMEYNADAQTVSFKGNVHVLRTDFELWANQLTVFLQKNNIKNTSSANGSAAGMRPGNMDHIVAEGNVKMKSADKEGACEKATYYSQTDKIVMEGSPTLHDPKNTITGKVITHFIGKNYSRVDGTVSATFQTPDTSEPTE